jgi:hypothetical protein
MDKAKACCHSRLLPLDSFHSPIKKGKCHACLAVMKADRAACLMGFLDISQALPWGDPGDQALANAADAQAVGREPTA